MKRRQKSPRYIQDEGRCAAGSSNRSTETQTKLMFCFLKLQLQVLFQLVQQTGAETSFLHLLFF